MIIVILEELVIMTIVKVVMMTHIWNTMEKGKTKKQKANLA